MKIAIATPLCLLMASAMSISSAAELPTQKPGLWQMTIKTADMPGGSRSFQICEDAAYVAASKVGSAARLKKDCTASSNIRKVGETWVSDSDCTFSGMHVVTHSVTTIHGDEFHTDATSTTSTATSAKTTDVMTMDNKWLGACKAGQKVGVPLAGP